MQALPPLSNLDTSEPQPDAALIITPACGGQTSLSEDGYVTGPPELIVEGAASSSAAMDCMPNGGIMNRQACKNMLWSSCVNARSWRGAP